MAPTFGKCFTFCCATSPVTRKWDKTTATVSPQSQVLMATTYTMVTAKWMQIVSRIRALSRMHAEEKHNPFTTLHNQRSNLVSPRYATVVVNLSWRHPTRAMIQGEGSTHVRTSTMESATYGNGGMWLPWRR